MSVDVQLYHGDCLEVMKQFENGQFDAVVTDPPYGIGFDTDYTRFTGGVSNSRRWDNSVANDDKPFDPGPFISFGKIAVLWGANNYSDKLPQGSFFVWDKRYKGKPLVVSDGEVAWCSKGHGVYIFNHYWDGFMRESERSQKRLHPTQKPVELMRWCIERVTNEGDTILDPFMGSGTTGVACVQTGRNFVGIEIDEGYFEIAKKHIEEAQAQMRLPMEVAQ